MRNRKRVRIVRAELKTCNDLISRKRGGVNVELISEKKDLATIIREKVEYAKQNYRPMFVNENGYNVLNKSAVGRKSMAQNHLEEKYGYADEE